jgi:HK97 family phage prohead protease
MTDLSSRAAIGGYQRRTFELTEFEFRADDSSDTWTFEGIACTVGHAYAVRDFLGEYEETIAPDAFKRSLNDPNARIELRWNHDPRREPYAVFDRKSGAASLSVRADPDLRVTATLDRSRPDVQVLRSLVANREVSQMSIGFNDVKGGASWNEDFTARTVNDMRLIETSVVGRGANDLTEASIRSLTQELSRYSGDVDEAEVRRAIAYLEGLLPRVEQAAEVVESTGLIVTDEFIRLYELKFAGR